MRKIRFATVVGARPQFVKAATLSRAIRHFNAGADGVQIEERLIHTGQHYDYNMSKVFFEELEIAEPAINLGVRSASHGRQTGDMLKRLESDFLENPPDWTIVYGDTNSTLAGALSAAKLHIPVAHVEAGLRSYNRAMPEEINRSVTDVVSDALFCPTEASVANLAREGRTEGVFNVGDVMYDALLHYARIADTKCQILEELNLADKAFNLATVHRAENTDVRSNLAAILQSLASLSRPTLLPLHPRTRRFMAEHSIAVPENVRLVEPVSYFEMLTLERAARIILTDSGGVQKEAYWFGVPCVTLRNETEWVELVDAGCNRLAGVRTDSILAAVTAFERAGGLPRSGRATGFYGDGNAADAIVRILVSMN